jgi:hypothetical protein
MSNNVVIEQGTPLNDGNIVIERGTPLNDGNIIMRQSGGATNRAQFYNKISSIVYLY